jgi:hypothetical protein
MTGRAAGYCAGYPVPGYASPGGGRGFWGFGRGRGGGYGRRNRFFATGLAGWQRAVGGWPFFGGNAGAVAPQGVSSAQQLDLLKGQAEYFESALNDIRTRIEELEARSNKTKE